MTPGVAEALRIVAARKPLPRELAERTFLDLMDGKATEAQKGALLLGIATRGETAEEIAGAVAALRTRMRRVATRRAARVLKAVERELSANSCTDSGGSRNRIGRTIER